MSPARRWYERLLAALLISIGLVLLLPLGGLWVWARHQYTVGLSVSNPNQFLMVCAFVCIGFGIVAILGGVALLKRS